MVKHMLTPGTVLHDRYSLQQQINDNPSRQTWLAQDNQLTEPVVIKLLALGGAVQWDDLKLFEREAMILRQLDHPQIPKYRDYFSLDDRTLWFALVQDYIPGSSLKQLLTQGKIFTPSEIQQIAFYLLPVLDFLHHINPPILHRDLKPSNIIWGDNNLIYLIDFGSVQARPNTPGSTFTVVGTYGYTPMEQFGGQAVPASDLYALGATLIHLLTSIPPSDLPQQDLQLQFRDRLNNKIPPYLISWLEKLTQPSLQKRFQTALEALTALSSQSRTLTNNSVASPSPISNVFITKTSETLTIEIPSRFELKFLLPLRRLILQGAANLEQYYYRLIDRFNTLEKPQQKKLLTLGIVGFIAVVLLDSLQVFSLLGWVWYLVFFILKIPLALLPIILPLVFIYQLFLKNQTLDDFERVKLTFDKTSFEIARTSWSDATKERGVISQIQNINLTSLQENFGGTEYQVISISTNPYPIIFGNNTEQLYTFGHQLSDSDLRLVLQEINNWVDQN